MVKKLVERWSPPQHQSFNVKHYNVSYDEPDNQEMVLRQHREVEITLLLGCKGKRFIGTTFENFYGADLFMLGSQLPHHTRYDHGEAGEAHTLHFLPETFGEAFFSLPECGPVAHLLSDASVGIVFEEFNLERVIGYFDHLGTTQGFDRVLSLLHLLDYLARVPRRRRVNSRVNEVQQVHVGAESEEVNRAYNYILDRFREKRISLGDISEHMNMSSATFCRFFKKHFHKTFTVFLNEVRIGHACKMLQDSQRNINEIAYASGYRQLTHFNRQFKRHMKLTPKQYREQLHYHRGR